MNANNNMEDTIKNRNGGYQKPSDTPFISVMVLNYNYANLLTRALEACAAQTFRDFDVVMINNGAIDNTEEVYNSFCAKHPEIRTTYVHVEPNQGPMHGWNEGLKQARGEFVMLHDADDWMEPDCLEELARKAKETGADRVIGNMRDVLPNGEIVRNHHLNAKVSVQIPALQGVILRRSVIMENEVFFPDDTDLRCFDYWMIYHFAAVEKNRGVFVDKTVYNYLVSPSSVMANMWTSGDNDDLFDLHTKALILFTAELCKDMPDKKLRDELEYLTIKGAYAHTLNVMRHWSPEGAKKYHDQTQKALLEYLPDWKKNPHLWPFGNGFELFPSVSLYALVWMDRLHAAWLLRLAGKMSRFLKYRR